ncbi:hypothetical protein [Deinococcus malanensis]|uniref:hypothetical protein n=1 Tax=Deinococcus malanensis TaxID=1706855 RepID=UPI001E41FF00|nr:hypothetical protein [Deinococcus malanensis]
MSVRLNLAALTPEELAALFGEDGAQLRLPEVSRARLEKRALPGPVLSRSFEAQPLEDRPWGATPEQTRALGSHDAQLRAAGATPLGVFYLPLVSEVRHVRAYLLEPDLAISLRWSETPESSRTAEAYLEFLSLLRDRASGSACVLSSGNPRAVAPSPSEEVDLHQHSSMGAEDLLAAHRQHVLRHGRGQKLVTADAAGWMRTWQTLHTLNFAAWSRRGLLLEEPGLPGTGG